MKKRTMFKGGIKPTRILPIGFLIVILSGTLLLMLPIATKSGSLSFFDAFFTATSATCVTGLVVADTGTFFTGFGQAVILAMIQLGGLGFMTVATFLFLAIGKKISLKERMTMAESLGENKLQGVLQLCMNVLKVTFLIEAIGALLLAIRFIPAYGWPKGIWNAVFHSISAFCNAGFDLMGNYTSLTAFVKDPLVSLTICFLVITGGLGFGVVMDCYRKKNYQSLRIQSKLVLGVTFLLLVVPTLLFFLFEANNSVTMGSLTTGEKLMASFFQAVTCRTAGFNTIDQLALYDSSKFLSVMLMFIGGAPAGTAGGIKLTTISVLILSVRSLTHNRADTELFQRKIPQDTVRRALAIFLIGLASLFIAVLAVSILETHTAVGDLGFLNQFYELTSAIGTVGLSLGVTGQATVGTRMILCLLMFMGRVGILTIALALGSNHNNQPLIKYPETDIMVG